MFTPDFVSSRQLFPGKKKKALINTMYTACTAQNSSRMSLRSKVSDESVDIVVNSASKEPG